MGTPFLNDSSALDDPDEDDDDGEYQQEMDEAAQHVESDEAKGPQNDQDNCDGP
jgi:hypothetical protein